MAARIWDKATVLDYAARLERDGATVTKTAETARAAVAQRKGLVALAKGRRGPWIVRLINTKFVTWSA